jgi:hypothetical protein
MINLKSENERTKWDDLPNGGKQSPGHSSGRRENLERGNHRGSRSNFCFHVGAILCTLGINPNSELGIGWVAGWDYPFTAAYDSNRYGQFGRQEFSPSGPAFISSSV